MAKQKGTLQNIILSGMCLLLACVSLIIKIYLDSAWTDITATRPDLPVRTGTITLTIAHVVSLLLAAVGLFPIEKISVLRLVHALAQLIVAIATIELVHTVGDFKGDLSFVYDDPKKVCNNIRYDHTDSSDDTKMKSAIKAICNIQSVYFGVASILICAQIILAVLSGYFSIAYNHKSLKCQIIVFNIVCGGLGLGFFVITAQLSGLLFGDSALGPALITLTVFNAITILIAILGIFAALKEKASLLKMHALALLIVTIATIGLVTFIGKINRIINLSNQPYENVLIYFTIYFMMKEAYSGIALVLICVQIISTILSWNIYFKDIKFVDVE